MKTIAITGGIGSGKSHLAHLVAAKGYPVFYADDIAKQIIRTQHHVQRELQTLVDEPLFTDNGELRKNVLANFITQGKSNSEKVDAIVHPCVIEAWKTFINQHLSEKYIFMECALLFESSMDQYCDASILVSCPLEERIRRVMKRDNKDRETVLRWMSLQMSEEEKATRATWILTSGSTQTEEQQLIQIGILSH